MKITVQVKPNAREEKVEQVSESTLKVSVTVPPEKGKANEAMRKALAAHFGVAPSRVRIMAGHAARVKIVEIT